MATCGGHSFERTLVEAVDLMELKEADYTDLELAALVGDTLRKMTLQQEEEIARLKCMVDERNQKLKRLYENCPSFASLEATYDQPMNMLDKEIAFLARLNEECTTKIRKYHTLLECSAEDQQNLSRVLQDLNATMQDCVPSESSRDHCILCVCAADKESMYNQRRNRIYKQLAEKSAAQVASQKELDNCVADRKTIQDEIDILSRQVDYLSRIVVEIEEEEKKGPKQDLEDEQGCQAGDDHLLWREDKKKQEPRNLCSKCRESKPESPKLSRKTSGRFVDVVQSLML